MAFDPSCIDVADYLECLEFENVHKATETEYRFSCPYPAHVSGDETPSAYMNVNTTAFFCHSCHAKGNAISLAAAVLKVSPLEAIIMLKERYSPGGIHPDARNMVEEVSRVIHKEPIPKRENRILPEDVLQRYEIYWPDAYRQNHPAAVYMIQERWISLETLNDWQFGYSERHNRITLPIRDENGKLVGIKARAIDGRKPKYLNLRDEENEIEPYLKNEIVFGLDRAKQYFEEWKKIAEGVYVRPSEHRLIVCEGELNAICLHALGYRGAVAINGSYFGQRQMRLIREHADSVTLFFDTDQAGSDATTAVSEELSPFMPVRVVPDHEGDPAVMHGYSIRRCIEQAKPYREILLLRS